MKHTPGPWNTSGESIVSEFYCLATIEDDGGYEAPITECEANLRLMAAAPELLEACKAALPQVKAFRCTDPNGETVGNPVIELLCAAIAKAEEEPKRQGHLFSPHTHVCVKCGCTAEDDAIANEECNPQR